MGGGGGVFVGNGGSVGEASAMTTNGSGVKVAVTTCTTGSGVLVAVTTTICGSGVPPQATSRLRIRPREKRLHTRRAPGFDSLIMISPLLV